MTKILSNLLLVASANCIGSSITFAAVDNTEVTPAQVQSIVGKVMVPKYNTAKTSAALIGKIFVGTLELPRRTEYGGADFVSELTTKALNKAGIYFACKDFPDGFSTSTIKTYKVTAKIIKFEVGYEGDSDDVATITLDKCATTVAKTAFTPSLSSQPSTMQMPSPSLAKSASIQKTLDEQFYERKSSECASGFGGLICHEKLRYAMCNDKWSDNPPTGQSTCRGASTKQ